MLDFLLAQLERHEALLVQAIEDDDSRAIVEFDRNVQRIWRDVLVYQPLDDGEAGRLFAFLLDVILRETGARDGHLFDIRNKLASLCRLR
ncbi:hypothetical protein ACLB6G_18445 [Zhengella sp. ZM62]|uniref:hypothetical protein n=1 Tax=Zhengella sedimenti TaxID=3390035 RepID=UPI003976A35C